MILDYELQLSKDQAITATAPSTNIVDLKASKDLGVGEPLRPVVRVATGFNTLTSLDISVEASNDPAFGSGVTTLVTKNVLLAGLTANAAIPMPGFAAGNSLQYVRGKYTVNGANPTAGTVEMYLVPGVDSRAGNARKF